VISQKDSSFSTITITAEEAARPKVEALATEDHGSKVLTTFLNAILVRTACAETGTDTTKKLCGSVTLQAAAHQPAHVGVLDMLLDVSKRLPS